jgi:hypothetical protein
MKSDIRSDLSSDRSRSQTAPAGASRWTPAAQGGTSIPIEPTEALLRASVCGWTLNRKREITAKTIPFCTPNVPLNKLHCNTVYRNFARTWNIYVAAGFAAAANGGNEGSH